MIATIASVGWLIITGATQTPRVHEQLGGARAQSLGTTLAAAGLFGSVWGTWIDGRVGNHDSPVHGWAIPVVSWVAAAAALVMTVIGAQLCFRNRAPSRISVILFSGVAAIVCIFIIVIECLTEILPLHLLPDSLRRAAFEASAGPALWFALAFCAVGIVAASEAVADRIRPIGALVVGSSLDLPAALLTAASIAGIVLVGVTRRMAWVTASAVNHSAHLSGWMLPFLGPLSLLALLAAATSMVAVFSGRLALGALGSGVAATLLVVPSAVFATIPRASFTTSAITRVFTRLGTNAGELALSTSGAPLLQYAAALGFCASTVALTMRLSRLGYLS